MRRLLYALASFAAALALLIPTTTPAQAAPGDSTLYLSWDYWNGYGEEHTATLVCDTLLPGGTHPDPVGACLKVTLVGGDLANLPDDLRTCTTQYNPVIVLGTGMWLGQPVFYIDAFDNSCLAFKGTNGVFDF